MTELKTILFVEDDPDVFELVDIALNMVGKLDASGYMSGAEAVDAAPGVDPQLILLDVMMPKMDGPATLEQLHRLKGFQDKLYVFLTAKVQTEEVERLKGLGASAVLSKPFDPVLLADKLREIWRTNVPVT